jgi:hypothetical protein
MTALRTARVAVWFAPACILLSQVSPATLAAALLLVISATRLLYAEWVKDSSVPAPAVAAPVGLFGGFTVKRPMVTRELLTGVAAAVALQSGIISVWRHKPMLAGACFVLSAAITTLFALVSGAVESPGPASMPRSIIGMAMTVLLAAGLTVGEADGNPASAPRGAVASAKEILKDLFDDDKDGKADGKAAGKNYVPKAPPLFPPAGVMPDGTFPGVILMPEVKPVARLVAPPPSGISSGMNLERPYGIPFDGPYLFYRWPADRPPASSILQRGTPAALAYSTPDHWPLTMDAIQKFDEPVDLSCCRAVRIEVWNADRFPGTVSLDLYCNDHRVGGAPVRSTPDLHRDPVVAVPESIEIPSLSGGRCREFRVTFRRDHSRADRSARISIDRFVLVP